MRTSDQINEIATALAKAQGAIEGAKKDSVNPHFRSKYADLGAVWDACREALSKNGISVIQPIVSVHHIEDDRVVQRVTITRLMHSSGQWIEDGGVPLILSKDDMQGLGSALTYSRRYGLMAMVGIAPEDDDGNAATAKTHTPIVEVTAEKPKTPVRVPDGAVLIRKVEQLETEAKKMYFQIVLEGGETLMTWNEGDGKAAEQYCQNHEPIRLQVGAGTFKDMPVIKKLLSAKPQPPAPAPVKELAASDIGF